MDNNKQITWRDIYLDFCKRFPSSAKLVSDYRPYAYMTIIIWFKDNVSATYNYQTKSFKRM